MQLPGPEDTSEGFVEGFSSCIKSQFGGDVYGPRGHGADTR
jgi:hypothetical protein